MARLLVITSSNECGLVSLIVAIMIEVLYLYMVMIIIINIIHIVKAFRGFHQLFLVHI